MMDQLLIPPLLLALLFFMVALTYSSVGLGGGSSYTALMAIFGVSYLVIPTVSLSLNLIVTTVGSYNFIRQRHARLRLILPFFVTSIPFSYLGGVLKLPRNVFYLILLISLIFVALRIYFWDNVSLKLEMGPIRKILLSLAAGSILGLVAGIVGIGGGIYLVPLIIILGLGSAKEAAACGALFVWVNSLSGLAARLQHQFVSVSDYIPLMIAVLLGGTLGSFMGSSKLAPRTLERILGGVIIIAILFLARKIVPA